MLKWQENVSEAGHACVRAGLRVNVMRICYVARVRTSYARMREYGVRAA